MQSWLAKTSIGRPDSFAPERNPHTLPEIEAQTIRQFIRNSGMQVLTLAGYSGAGYQYPEQMLEVVSRALEDRDPAQWLICSGATSCGIGAAYEVAKQAGFTTLGIVSSKALEERVEVSPYLDYVFFVEDSKWGGRLDDGTLSPTSREFVETGDEFLVIGGNGIARDEILAAHLAGKPVTYIQADMNHERAVARAGQCNNRGAIDFHGLAHAELSNLLN
ncbi:MAG: hypothetical protein R3F41_00375 [Gammaproteobacteria bacterium]|nr:hypothetical protein [Planctomycetaceae bacterium]MCB1671851.1 hypothetical protein [Pseudomonadales bacterium]MCP5346236.1 hypothetical protein [Pseudomonadales bacterium]